jgi:hypothetical protein
MCRVGTANLFQFWQAAPTLQAKALLKMLQELNFPTFSLLLEKTTIEEHSHGRFAD